MLVHHRVTPQQYNAGIDFTPVWRETKWSTVPCLRKQRDGQGLNPGPPDTEFEVLSARQHTPPQKTHKVVNKTCWRCCLKWDFFALFLLSSRCYWREKGLLEKGLYHLLLPFSFLGDALFKWDLVRVSGEFRSWGFFCIWHYNNKN